MTVIVIIIIMTMILVKYIFEYSVLERIGILNINKYDTIGNIPHDHRLSATDANLEMIRPERYYPNAHLA